MMDHTTFFWLVGLLEGEGCFLKPSPSKPREPKIDVEMTDEDVIRRVASLFGVRYRVRQRPRKNVHTTYHVRLGGKRAVRLMWMLRPFMSARRQQQIDRAIACYYERGPEFYPENLPVYEFAPVCEAHLCGTLAMPGEPFCEQHTTKSAAA